MTKDKDRHGPGAPKGPTSRNKNVDALAEALRANLHRRKARERALRAGGAETPAETANDGRGDSEGTWTK